MKRKKMLGIALAACVLMSPLGVARAGEEGASAEIGDGFEQTEGAPLGTLAVDPSLRSFGLSKRVNQYEAKGDGKVMLRQTWTELHLADGDGRSMLNSSNFPKLAAALEAYNYSTIHEAYRAQGELREEALREYQERKKYGSADYFGGYSSYSDIIVKRADTRVMSFVEMHSEYRGGAHGMTVLRGVNFDTSTGERLSLHHVFPDAEMLIRVITEKLYAENEPVIFFDSMEGTVADGVIHDKISWVIGPRGVTFYFNPYDIAPYASGIISTTVMFDDRPGLFRGTYNQGPASYCEELIPYHAGKVSLRDDGSGRAETIVAYAGEGKLDIVQNGKVIYRKPFVGGNEIKPVFVHTGAGDNYLYIDYGFDSEQMGAGRQIDVIALDAGKASFVKTVPFSFRRMIDLTDTGEHWTEQWIMTDPYEFNIDESHISVGGASKTHTVEIGDKGEPTFG